jgi:hypothetical protein
VAGRAPDGDLTEGGAVAIPLARLAELVRVPLLRPGAACRDHEPAARQPLIQEAGVHTAGVERLFVKGRATTTVLDGHAGGGEETVAAAIAPEQPRPGDSARVLRQVRPAVGVHVAAFVPVTAAEEGESPRAGQWRAEEGHGVGAAAGGSVQQELPLGAVARLPRYQVDDAAHGAGTVQRRGHALDHLDLRQVHRRDLQQAKPAHFTEQRQAVGQEARVAPAHALHPHARRAQRRRGGLHAHAAHFVEHHGNVAWRHEHLLFDLFALEDFDAERLIIEPAAGAGGRYRDGDFDVGGLLDGVRCRR